MTVSFARGDIKIWHSSQMGNLQDVFHLGNNYRFAEGKSELPLTAWIQRQDITEYVEFLTAKLGRPAIERKRGKSGGTFAHLNILLDAAVSLSPEFKDEVYTTFIAMKLLTYRNDSGDAFVDMNSQLALCADLILGKPAHQGHYIQIAKAIRNRILPEAHEGWNFANAKQLQERYSLEEKISMLLRVGVVKDWDHLKELITIA